MHAVRILHKWMGDALPGIHKARLKVMFAGVEALLRGQRLWLAALRQNVGGRTLSSRDSLLNSHTRTQR